jgi:copper chaperone CopZ
MTTSTLEVGDLFSVLGAHGMERQLQRLAGVGVVSVNPVSGATAVVYDPAKTSLAAIRAAIKECGFHCAGEALPRHVCDGHRPPSLGMASAVTCRRRGIKRCWLNGDGVGRSNFHTRVAVPHERGVVAGLPLT